MQAIDELASESPAPAVVQLNPIEAELVASRLTTAKRMLDQAKAEGDELVHSAVSLILGHRELEGAARIVIEDGRVVAIEIAPLPTTDQPEAA